MKSAARDQHSLRDSRGMEQRPLFGGIERKRP
jgi:hypothetical protein